MDEGQIHPFGRRTILYEREEKAVKLIKTEDAVGSILCHDITRYLREW